MWYNNIVLKGYFGFEHYFNQIGKMSRIIFSVKINGRNDKYEKNISVSHNGYRN
ncbi:putative response regulator receiver protein [Leptotrichia trevisanii]|uniref:Putative response regulator receiver protein n=1 Tax=Leptotrichia trevisanii TaxID=109328 RepID=A0A510K1R4_9FUSO|nr:putative response regulator receiver protein [Leptotrichia trevisanii]